MMQSTGTEMSLEIKAMVEITQVAVVIRHVNIVENLTIEATVLPMAKSAKSAAETAISNQFVEVVMINVILVAQGQRKAIRESVFTRLMRRKMRQWMI